MLIEQLWTDYVFHKQTVRELSKEYHKDKRTIRDLLNAYETPEKIYHPREVYIIVDATYFGERKAGHSWCVLVARDTQEQEDLTWLFTDTETTFAYTQLREQLDSLGYTILSVTGDGFSGIKTAFSGIPYQMCHVHMERIVIQGTTRNPQTEAGKVLLALVRTLHITNSHLFHTRLTAYLERYQDFLNEKTLNPETGRLDWTHAPLRKAVLSLVRLKPYLFTFEHNKNIPKTTNSLEGHFSHIKTITTIHRGVTKQHLQKMIHSILLSSTIAPETDENY